MRRIAGVLVGMSLLVFTLAGVGGATTAAGSGLVLVGVSLDGSAPSNQVVVNGDWGGEVLRVQGAATDTTGLTVTVGSTPCASPPTLTGSGSGFDVACVLPILAGGPLLDVTVGMGGQTATLTNAVAIPALPTVSRVSGCNDTNASTGMCPVAGGTTLTIAGTGFTSQFAALVGGRVCATLSAPSTTQRTCRLPPGSGTQPLTIVTGSGVVETGLSVGYATTPPTPLPAPTGVSATAGDRAATVSWSTAADPTATAYRVTPTAGGAVLPSVSFAVPAGGAPATMSVQVAGLTNGVPTSFTVAALDGTQVGTESAPSAAVVPAGLPAAPGRVTARYTRAGLTVSWTPPGDDGGSALTGYTITPYRDGVAGTPIEAPAGATSAQPKLPLGVYVFEVSAENAIGSGPASAPSAPILVVGGRLRGGRG